jgi:hypothetical protein
MDSTPLTFVLWRWRKYQDWSLNYGADHVNAMCRQIDTHHHAPHRIVCVTDDPDGIECETIPLWDHGQVETERGKPNCYRRLYAFSKDVLPLFGPRFVSIDLDCVILPGPDGQGITPLFQNDNDFMIVNGWRGAKDSPNGKGCCPYNGSMWMMNTGAREKVWTEFDPLISPQQHLNLRMPNGHKWFGSDQTWIALQCPDEKTWDAADGVYSFVRDARSRSQFTECRIMHFAGIMKPWTNQLARVNPMLWAEYKKYL